MPTEYNLYDDSFVAGADLSAIQYYAVIMSAANTVTSPGGAGEAVIGILQNKPKSGEAAAVMLLGRSRAVSDGTTAIAAGDWLGADADGKLIKVATDKNYALGRALSASTANGTVIDVLLTGATYLGV